MAEQGHVEKHFTAPESVRDIVLGMSDGLTVPFALAAGLSGAVSSTGIIVTAGVAEIAAGSIAMGFGGYLAARTESEHFEAERSREETETRQIPEVEAEEVAGLFRGYGLKPDVVNAIVKAICSDRKRWVDFMMKFELGLERPDPLRARRSAFTIAVSYMLGGFIPLSPYFFLASPAQALLVSVALTTVALFVFGYVRGKLTITVPLRSAWQTLAIGGISAAAAYAIARLVS
ncbi:MAG: VIT1/CCC1 transporter family protein [Deltaproteobacteria bacterium]|nr:VIT1/CCC1 transporter family protein [Deltaproteobacteria bacterium]